jgi:hypothetical protein
MIGRLLWAYVLYSESRLSQLRVLFPIYNTAAVKVRLVPEDWSLEGLYARILNPWRMDLQAVPEHQYEITTTRCLINQNSAVHVNFALLPGRRLKSCRFLDIVGYATKNECCNEKFLSIKSGSYNQHNATTNAEQCYQPTYHARAHDVSRVSHLCYRL